jgi:hypothetical protein
MAVLDKTVIEWVSSLDGGRLREILIALNRLDIKTAERVLGNALGRPISLEDPLLREHLLDALELRIAPEEDTENSETATFPINPIPSRDVRDEEATEEVDQVRRILR